VVDPAPKVDQECVEGYLFASPPLELLLFRRPPSRGSFWVPVSGKVDPTDPDLPSALCREIEEETGRAVTPQELVDLDWVVSFPMEKGETWRLHAYAVPVPRTFRPRLSSEHDAFEWVAADAAISRLHFDDNQDAVRRLRDRLS